MTLKNRMFSLVAQLFIGFSPDLLWRNAEQAAKLLLGQPALVAKGPEPLATVSVPHGSAS